MSFEPPDPFNLYDYLLGDRIAEGSGQRRALLTDEGAWAYDEVHEAAGRMAGLLTQAGVAPGDRVLVALPDGPVYVAAIFGILRMGAVVVMVNPHLSPDQIRYFYDYTTPAAALVHTGVWSSFAEAAGQSSAEPHRSGSAGSRSDRSDAPLVAPTAPSTHAASGGPRALRLVEVGSSGFDGRLAAVDADVPIHPTSPDDPAVFLFSGGTTGRPKAVVQTHRSFANTTELYGKGVLGVRADDVTLSVPKLYFGYATGSNLFFPFSVGATSALFPERCTADTLFTRIERFRPTILVNVPTMVNHLVSHETAPRRDLSSLRLATSAGEALPVELHRRWDETFGVPLLDGLGTAEMWHIFISNRPDDIRPGTLGRVVEGFEVKACDDQGREVDRGEPGIMRVRGDSLALGYWQDAEKTRAAFQDGWYLSGDMIVVDHDGYVTYAGRADDMLKVSGKWLSPGELESCLMEHEAVGEAVVVGARTEDGLVKPAAFVVPARGTEAGPGLAEELQAWAKARLEPYKYPRTVVFLEELPRTHLGKVDRGALARRVG